MHAGIWLRAPKADYNRGSNRSSRLTEPRSETAAQAETTERKVTPRIDALTYVSAGNAPKSERDARMDAKAARLSSYAADNGLSVLEVIRETDDLLSISRE